MKRPLLAGLATLAWASLAHADPWAAIQPLSQRAQPGKPITSFAPVGTTVWLSTSDFSATTNTPAQSVFTLHSRQGPDGKPSAAKLQEDGTASAVHTIAVSAGSLVIPATTLVSCDIYWMFGTADRGLQFQFRGTGSPDFHGLILWLANSGDHHCTVEPGTTASNWTGARGYAEDLPGGFCHAQISATTTTGDSEPFNATFGLSTPPATNTYSGNAVSFGYLAGVYCRS